MSHPSSSSHQEHLHDVHSCVHVDVAERLALAQQQSKQRGVRFTPLRQEVYELILKAEQPLGAYDLITQMQQARQNKADSKNKANRKTSQKNVAPPTVYRSLEFLLAEGLIHQLTSINAYVPCCHPRDEHTAAFLICERCQKVQECSSIPVQALMQFAKDSAGYAITHSVIELSGLCPDCQAAA